MKMNGDEVSSCLSDGKIFPPGFRFHPTDEELVLFYLKGKICRRRNQLDVITEADVYKWEPEELPGLSKLKTRDRQWFFYSPRDRKYPNGGRSNRATRQGYWKATGKDRVIAYKSRDVGVKKTLVFYKGRAPNGERTDWVMHEYTLDEEELKRCESAKDYYALCKVFKKSGPGPKNGEQYGAPFREEDWVGDGFEMSGFVEQEKCTPPDMCVKAPPAMCFIAPPANVDIANCQLQPLECLEEFVNRIADEPLPAPPLSVADYGFVLEELLYEEEAQSDIVDQPARQISLHEQSRDLHETHGYNVQASLDLTHSGTSQLLLHEASEVTSAPDNHSPYFHVAGEDLREVEDFLEMDDLLGPQPSVHNFENLIPPPENLQFDEFDGLSELDLYKDMKGCNGFEAGQQGQRNLPYVDNLDNEGNNPVSNLYLNNAGLESFNYEQVNMRNAANGRSQEWSYDQRSSVFSAAESQQGTVPLAISGVVYDGNFLNHGSGADRSQSGRQNDVTDSWISSALWAFVESIPTTPASAAESGALVSRAFERMSSFGRVKITNESTGVISGDTVATSKSSGKCKSGLYCFSLLGVMCAILWMLIGTSVGVMGKYLSS